jgi:hypothetical protein
LIIKPLYFKIFAGIKIVRGVKWLLQKKKQQIGRLSTSVVEISTGEI